MGEANKAIGSDMNNHSSTVLQAIGNLYTKIKSGSEDDREAGLKLMWSQLGSQDSVLVCQASADLISVLVRSGSLEANSCITQLLACLSHGMECSGILLFLVRFCVTRWRRWSGSMVIILQITASVLPNILSSWFSDQLQPAGVWCWINWEAVTVVPQQVNTGVLFLSL